MTSDIAVVTPAESLALTTVARQRAAADVPGADDVRLEMMIGVATARLERACDRTFARERVIETIYTDHPDALFLTRTPVVEVHAVGVGPRLESLLEVTTTGRSIVNASTGLLALSLNPWAGFGLSWSALTYPGTDWGYGWYGPRVAAEVIVQVEYTGGYAFPWWAGFSEADPRLVLPAELEAAVQELVRLSGSESTYTPGLVSKRLGDAAWTYAQPGSTDAVAARDYLPRIVSDAIATYGRVRL